MDVRSQDPLVLEALNLIVGRGMDVYAPGFERVRKEEIARILGLDRKASDDVLRYLKAQGWVRFVLFGCVQLTNKGREAAETFAVAQARMDEALIEKMRATDDTAATPAEPEVDEGVFQDWLQSQGLLGVELTPARLVDLRRQFAGQA